MTIGNNIVLHILKCLRVDFKKSLSREKSFVTMYEMGAN